jgi:hypothetical protein
MRAARQADRSIFIFCSYIGVLIPMSTFSCEKRDPFLPEAKSGRTKPVCRLCPESEEAGIALAAI